jgi:hypothetical protein
LEEVGSVASTRTRRLIRKLGDVTSVAAALSAFLQQLADCLRQLAHVIGWAVLIISAIALMIHPILSPIHFLAPGAGTLAILQSMIRPQRSRPDDSASAPAETDVPSPDEPLMLVTAEEHDEGSS